MDKRLSATHKKALMNTLEMVKDRSGQMKAKEEEKRWSEIKVPLTLADRLAALTKDDLSGIRSKLNIKGVSTLKKQELIEALVQQIPEALPNLLLQLDETQYSIMKKIADRGGHDYVLLESYQYDYFKDRGMIFTGTYKGKKILVMPQEVVEVFKAMDSVSYRQTVRRNTEWIRLIQGLLFYYGTLSLNELDMFMKHYMGTDMRLGEYLFVLEAAQAFYREVKLDSVGFSNYRVWDAKRLKEEQQIRLDLPFYPFTKDQLLHAGEPGFVDRNASYQAFVDFIRKNYEITRAEADHLVEECVYAIRIGEAPAAILEFLGTELEIDRLELMKGFMDHIVNLHNNTRQWMIKGYTPKELSAATQKSPISPPAAPAEVIDFVTRKKVGRNDPCPCGSGEKFKKCCGS